MVRGMIKSVVEGVIKRFSATGMIGQDIDDREYLQHYGYTSRPLEGAEAVIIRDGNHIVMIASDDRRYRIKLEAGEVALYDDLNQKVHLTRTGIEVESPAKITATAPLIEAHASTSATVFSPAINLGDQRAELLALIDERLLALFNNHTHDGVQTGGGTSGKPNSGSLTLANCCTTVTKAK